MSRVNEIEIVRLKGPVFFEIVEFKLYVGYDPAGLDRREVWSQGRTRGLARIVIGGRGRPGDGGDVPIPMISAEG